MDSVFPLLEVEADTYLVNGMVMGEVAIADS